MVNYHRMHVFTIIGNKEQHKLLTLHHKGHNQMLKLNLAPLFCGLATGTAPLKVKQRQS